jgi:hypothetical protein
MLLFVKHLLSENPGPGFGQTHKWGCVKPVKGMTTHTDKYFLIFI